MWPIYRKARWLKILRLKVGLLNGMKCTGKNSLGPWIKSILFNNAWLRNSSDKIPRHRPQVRSLRAKITKLESDVEIANQERDHLIVNLETEKQLSHKIKSEFEKLQAEYVEHQKISAQYAEQILGRDRVIEGR